FNSTLSGLAVGRCWDRATLLLEEMRQGPITPNVISYNTTISSFVDWEGDFWPYALECLELMRLDELQPDLVSFNTALRAAGARGAWQASLALME
ncbi:unnamed protein product, partial [Symbiodinium necroappetens]